MADQVGDGAWNADLEQGTLSFGDGQSFRVGLLGSFGEAAGTWMWAWANTHMSHLPETVLAASNTMKTLGDQHGIERFTTPEISADENDCALLAMIAVGALEKGAYYRGPYDGGAAYFVIEPETSLSGPTELARFSRLITEFTGMDVDAKAATEGFFRAEGFEVDTTGSALVATRAGSSFQIGFDAHGRVAGIDARLAPEPQAASPVDDEQRQGGFLARLFGRRAI